MKSLAATKTRVLAVVVAVAGLLGWIAKLSFPSEKIQFIGYAIERLWPEIICLIILIYFTTVYRQMLEKMRSVYAQAVFINKNFNGLIRKTFIWSMIIAITQSMLWVPKVVEQTAEAIDRRLGMYEYIFSGNYVNHLHRKASKKLAEGAPSSASRHLKDAANWALASESDKVRYSQYTLIAKARDVLASEMFEIYVDNKNPITNITGTAYIGGAFVLDRQTPKYARIARHRVGRLEDFKAKTSLVFSVCGEYGAQNLRNKGDQDACKYLLAQSIGLVAENCSEAARKYCDAFGLSGIDPRMRQNHYSSLFDRITGLTRLKAVVNTPLPEWQPAYYLEEDTSYQMDGGGSQ